MFYFIVILTTVMCDLHMMCKIKSLLTVKQYSWQPPPSNRESPPNTGTATPGTAIEIDDLEKFVFR